MECFRARIEDGLSELRGKSETAAPALTSRRARLISGAPKRRAPVAELADAHGSGPCSERSGGSTPLGRTTRQSASSSGNANVQASPALLRLKLRRAAGRAARGEHLGEVTMFDWASLRLSWEPRMLSIQRIMV